MSAICSECGAKKVEYRHRLTGPLVTGLQRLAQHGGGPINLKDIGLTRNQWDNFQKLRYFGLVEQSFRPNGTRIAGTWQITEFGREFLVGEVACPIAVWTYRGEPVRAEGEYVTVGRYLGEPYQHRPEWAVEALPHDPQDRREERT